ncbi:tripartite tricarboxylate transporter substrate binding protein [Paenibacillus sambharensis]|uniref:Tripartite tricarboxylate transporter substrate binding protein n=1 Tax=Paenibacillus sambharensis TaxID=1803190 RepID=A0A2W1LG06_9BACL|nr:tripartite tricarboxylate transporter substrate binding protein [Paenibacillus sambharensis]PZD96990.1 tripartite tricarboxylate transporter substrate binding protein [Paenibacillus sambharensis]
MKQIGALLLIILLMGLAGCSAGSGPAAEGKGEHPGAEGDTGSAAGFPKHPITYSIPFDPGGQSDLEARRQQPHLERILHTSVVITYKIGGGGAVGWSELAGKKPDGYFMAGINVPHIILQPLLQKDAGYQTEQLEPVAIFQSTPVGLAVRKDSSIQTLEDLIRLAKDKPGTLTAAGVGTYTGQHMTHLLFEKKTGITIQYIPFTGAAATIQSFLGGNTDLLWGNSNDLVSYKDEFRLIAIGSSERFTALPDTPTFVEQDVELTAGIDRGVAVPQGTPKEVIQVLEMAFLEIAADPDVIRQMTEEGFEPKAMGAAESKAYIEQLRAEYEPLVAELQP